MEIAKYLKYGEDNVLAVRVDSRENLNIPPFGYAIDYMTFGGMYREVYVQVRNKTHLRRCIYQATDTSSAGDYRDYGTEYFGWDNVAAGNPQKRRGCI